MKPCRSLWIIAGLLSLGTGGCSGSDGSNAGTGGMLTSQGGAAAGASNGVSGSTHRGGNGASGGVTFTGGTETTGGISSIGGSNATSGGISASGGVTSSGGALSTGGSSTAGGAANTGGANPAGGSSSTGGSRSAGGAATTGGANPTGGSASSSGGTRATGGSSSANGGNPTTGGTSTGGAPSTGGSKSTGGSQPTGGTKATGGNSNTGGASSGGTGAFACNLIFGNSTTQQWFDGGFLSYPQIDPSHWELVWVAHHYIDSWANPSDVGWTTAFDSGHACASNSTTPDRVIFIVTFSPPYPSEATYETDITAIVNNIKAKYPGVRRIEITTLVRAPGNSDTACSSQANNEQSIPAAEDQAIAAVAANATYAGLVFALPPFYVTSCSDFLTDKPQYTTAGATNIAQVYGAYYAAHP